MTTTQQVQNQLKKERKIMRKNETRKDWAAAGSVDTAGFTCTRNKKFNLTSNPSGSPLCFSALHRGMVLMQWVLLVLLDMVIVTRS